MNTDTQLKQALAKMLPEVVTWKVFTDETVPYGYLYWLVNPNSGSKVNDTERLQLCWLLEEALDSDGAEREDYICALVDIVRMTRSKKSINSDYFCVAHATWQQRVIALCKVKGITI